MSRQGAAQRDLIENPLRKPVNTLAIVPTKSSKITVLARKAYNVLLYIAQEQGIEQEVFRAPLQSILRGGDATGPRGDGAVGIAGFFAAERREVLAQSRGFGFSEGGGNTGGGKQRAQNGGENKFHVRGKR